MIFKNAASAVGAWWRRCVGVCQVFLAGFWLALSSMQLMASGDNSITLSDAIQRALNNNPSLKVFEFRYSSLQGMQETAQLRPAYEIVVDVENMGGTGDFKGTNNAEFTVALSSVLEMGGKRSARMGLVTHTRSVLDANRQVESLAVLGEVTRRYIDLLAAQEQVELAKEAAFLSDRAASITRKRATAGAIPEAEVKRALAASEQAKVTLHAEKQRLSYLRIALSATWGSTTPDFVTVKGDLFQFGEDIDLTTLISKLQNSPALEVYAAASRLKEAEIRLANTQSSADISWSVGVRRIQETDDAALVAGFSMPLFSGKRNRGALSSARAEKNQVWADRDALLIDLRMQLYRAFNSRALAIHTTKTLGVKIIPALEDALVDTQAAYQRGRYSYLDLVSARQELISAKRSYIDAAAAALTYGAEIEQLSAEPLPAAQYDINSKLSGSNQ